MKCDNYGRVELQEQKIYTYTVRTRNPPVWLCNQMCRILYGWMLKDFKWDRDKYGWVDVTYSFVRAKGTVKFLTAGRIVEWKLLDRMKFRDVLRLGWLWLWSKRVRS